MYHVNLLLRTQVHSRIKQRQERITGHNNELSDRIKAVNGITDFKAAIKGRFHLNLNEI